MNCEWRKGRQADRDVLGPFRIRRAIADPVPAWHDDRLATPNIPHAIPGLNAQLSPQNDSKLIELRSLAGLAPPRRTGHPGGAQSCAPGGDTPNEFLDGLGGSAGGLD